MFKLQSNIRDIITYDNLSWAIHSGYNYASFFKTTIFIVDLSTGEIVHICD